MSALYYQSGFGNHLASEAFAGALPKDQNSPQKVPYGLYAEQLSGTSFLAPRDRNQRSWLYRIRPSVLHKPFQSLNHKFLRGAPFEESDRPTPNQLRWNPPPYPKKTADFLDGLVTMGGSGVIDQQLGYAIHLYVCNKSMENRFFYNADGDLLILPQEGELILKTEFGAIEIAPKEIAVVQRGIKFQVVLKQKTARGYICENYGEHFRLPDLGPIGANGLANPRDFLTPVAAYEEKEEKCQLITKFLGNLWAADIRHSPLDVVAWHGNYAPYKYNLELFQAINTVSFDHSDPSIFTVLTSPSPQTGAANVDFVIFPERWLVAEHTFRPPYFHRNYMSEFMGLIYGAYDAKAEGFYPGGGSLHNCMSAHGPDTETYVKAIKAKLKPKYLKGTLAFMLESRYICKPTPFALETSLLQDDYYRCWQGLKSNFNPKKKPNGR